MYQALLSHRKLIYWELGNFWIYVLSEAFRNMRKVPASKSSAFLFACIIPELQENTEALRTKMSELRLYCDLLLQQVNKIKENDELGETVEVRLRFGWADEMREAAGSVKYPVSNWLNFIMCIDKGFDACLPAWLDFVSVLSSKYMQETFMSGLDKLQLFADICLFRLA